MAKYETSVRGDHGDFLAYLEREIENSSVSVTFEDSSDFRSSDSCCSVRVYERYSYMGGNRVSLNLTVFSQGESIRVSAITSGGSQAMFFKINTIGEDAFLEKIVDIIERYRG